MKPGPLESYLEHNRVNWNSSLNWQPAFFRSNVLTNLNHKRVAAWEGKKVLPKVLPKVLAKKEKIFCHTIAFNCVGWFVSITVKEFFQALEGRTRGKVFLILSFGRQSWGNGSQWLFAPIILLFSLRNKSVCVCVCVCARARVRGACVCL